MVLVLVRHVIASFNWFKTKILMSQFFGQVIKSWDGGSESLFSLLWTSHISSYANLKEHLFFVFPSVTLRNQLESALNILNDTGSDFASLLTDFLKGSGVPCPDLFDDAKVHFSNLVDLSQIHNDGFRARMFCWAVTGSCDREQGASPLTVSVAKMQF